MSNLAFGWRRILPGLLGLAALGLLGACAVKNAVQPSASPASLPQRPARPSAALCLEAGMHILAINGIDVDSAGHVLVSGSDDGRVRVWDLDSGELLQVLRLWTRDDQPAAVDAVALTPDGETVAAAGAESITLFDRRTGQEHRAIRLNRSVAFLVFSRDGTRLAAGMEWGGFRVFDVMDGRELGGDTQGGGSMYGADFDASGRLVTASSRRISLYGRDLRLHKEVEAPTGAGGIAFSPDGLRIAVGNRYSGQVDLLSGEDLAIVASPDSKGTSGSLHRVAWAPDGSALYAAGDWNRGGIFAIRRWADGGLGAFRDFDGPSDQVVGLRGRLGGQVVFGARSPAWGILDAEGRPVQLRGPVTADFQRTGGLTFGVAPDGKTVAFHNQISDHRTTRFALAGRVLQVSPEAEPGLRSARTEADGLTVTGWKGTERPLLNGQPLNLSIGERSQALAVAPDGGTFLLGTSGLRSYHLRLLTRGGAERWTVAVPATPWAVHLTEDGRLAVAAFGDGIIRWFRASDGQFLLALFPHADGRRWVFWTAGGYYDTSEGGEDLICWRRGRLINPAQFSVIRNPEVIDLILETLDEVEAVRRAETSLAVAAAPAPVPPAPPPAQRPSAAPVVTLLDPAPGSTVGTSPLAVTFNVHSPSGARVTAVQVRVDGRPVTSRDVAWTQAADFRHAVEVPIPPRDCEVEIAAVAGGVASAPARLPLRWKAPGQRARQRLFVLAVGISKYQDPAYRLDYAAQDAADVAAAWRRAEDRGYSAVETWLLRDEKATRDAILEALDEIGAKATPEDVVAVFLAGHGINHRGGYFFLPWDADLRWPSTRLVSDTALREALQRLPGRVALFLDTCRAGSLRDGAAELRRRLDVTRFIEDLTYYGSRLMVFSAAADQQLSQESAAWKNGAFTEALLEGLGGAADLNRNREVTAAELDLFLSDRVRTLTRDAQTPVTAKPLGLADFVLVRTP
jgi:Caspase domain